MLSIQVLSTGWISQPRAFLPQVSNARDQLRYH